MARITMTIMVYQGGEPRLEGALRSAIGWIQAETEFEVVANVVYSARTPAVSFLEGGYFLTPWDVYWPEIPRSQWVFLLWDCGDLAPCPFAAGGTWGLGDWSGTGEPLIVCSVPYGVWWDIWAPSGGFNTHLEQIVLHEWKNGLVSWLNDGYGYRVLNTYSNGEYIDCGRYPEETRYADCYRELLAQLTPEMYVDLTGEAVVPPPTLGERMGSLMSPLVSIAMLGMVLGMVARTREEERW